MTTKPLLLFPLTLALPLPLAGAEVLDVGGPNPDHDQIEDAVVAAQDGDVLRIWPGHYESFWIDDKTLSLVSADDSGAVVVDGTFRVKNLAPHRSVEISGVSATALEGHALVVSDCQGSVRVREGVFVGGDIDAGYWNTTSGVFVTQCSDVELVFCTARGAARLDHHPYYVGAEGDPGLTVESSQVSLFSSTFEGCPGGPGLVDGADGGSGGGGIEAWDGGRLYISGCTLIGGGGGDAGGPESWECPDGGHGGSGYAGLDPQPEAWLLDNVYLPGEGGADCYASSTGDAPDGQETKGDCLRLPGAARLLRASRLIDDTSSIGLIFTGTPGDLVCLQACGSPAYTFDAERGPFLLATRPLPELRPWKILGTIGAGGTFSTSIGVADLPALGHHTRHLQGNLVGAQNYFTSSSWTVILDGAW